MACSACTWVRARRSSRAAWKFARPENAPKLWPGAVTLGACAAERSALPKLHESRVRCLPMAVSPLAGKPAPANILIDPERLVAAYYGVNPDPENAEQQVSFGT